MEKLTGESLEEFIEDLSAKKPVPGGGGAAAVVAAAGAALCSMVGEFTIGKKKYAANDIELKRISASAKELSKELLELADADAAAFGPLSKAYAIPKDAPERDAIMEKCLRNAALPPMKIARLCCDAIELHEKMGKMGSAMMLSDIATGVIFCKSALQGAAVNVKVNTRLMKDRSFANEIDSEISERLGKYLSLADEIYIAAFGRNL